MWVCNYYCKCVFNQEITSPPIIEQCYNRVGILKIYVTFFMYFRVSRCVIVYNFTEYVQKCGESHRTNECTKGRNSTPKGVLYTLDDTPNFWCVQNSIQTMKKSPQRSNLSKLQILTPNPELNHTYKLPTAKI